MDDDTQVLTICITSFVAKYIKAENEIFLFKGSAAG